MNNNVKLYTIYQLAFPNGKVYIGLTKNLKNRIESHIWHRSSKGRPIFHAIKKYKDSFQVSVLEKNLSLEEAEFLEKYYIKQCDSTDIKYGYNLSPGGTSGNIQSSEGKRRWKEKMIAYISISEHKQKATKTLNDNREKAKIAHKEFIKNNPNFYKNVNKGRKRTNETILKQARSRGGRDFYCVETGEIFQLLTQAAKRFGVDKRRIFEVLIKRKKTIFKKYTFRYVGGE